MVVGEVFVGSLVTARDLMQPDTVTHTTAVTARNFLMAFHSPTSRCKFDLESLPTAFCQRNAKYCPRSPRLCHTHLIRLSNPLLQRLFVLPDIVYLCVCCR